MNLRKRNLSAAVILLSILLALMLAGCSQQPKTLADAINSDEEARQTIESLNSDGLEVAIEENTVVYTYTYPETYAPEMVELIKPEAEKMLGNQASVFESLASTLEEETGISGIGVRVIYLNGDGSEIIRQDF